MCVFQCRNNFKHRDINLILCIIYFNICSAILLSYYYSRHTTHNNTKTEFKLNLNRFKSNIMLYYIHLYQI